MAVWNVINHQELSGSAATVTHSSISGSYDHLHGIISARSTAGDSSGTYYYVGMMLNFNNDTGSNYSFTDVQAYSSTISTFQASNQTKIGYPPIPAGSALADTFGVTEFWIPNYANTSNYKQIWINSTGTNNSITSSQWELKLTAGLWASTAAISEIDFTINGGHDFVQYSSFTLYGINGAA